MRITELTMYRTVQGQLQNHKQTLADINASVSTGRKIHRLEQDTILVEKTLTHQKEEADLKQYESNLTFIQRRYLDYEAHIQQAYDVLANLKVTMTQLANPHDAMDVRADMGNTITQARDQLLAIANSKSNGQYIFSGARTDVEAYAADGTYQGDSVENQIDIMPAAKLESNITGEILFGGVGETSGVNVFEFLNDLEDAIQAPSPENAIAQYIDEVDQCIDQTIHERTRVGVRLSQIDLSQATLARLQIALTEKRSTYEDTDYTEALTDFKLQEYALQANMQTNARILQPTLLNYLR